jgi:GT2 family glycosyltransferase
MCVRQAFIFSLLIKPKTQRAILLMNLFGLFIGHEDFELGRKVSRLIFTLSYEQIDQRREIVTDRLPGCEFL